MYQPPSYKCAPPWASNSPAAPSYFAFSPAFSSPDFFIDSYPISTPVLYALHRLIIYANMRFFTFVSLAVLAATSAPALAVPTGIQCVILRRLAPSSQR
jgi:hypothetical protein